MSSQKGYSTQEKDDRLSAQFQTIEPVRELQYGSTVVSHQFVYEVGTDAAEAGSTAYSIVASAHTALKGDVILLTSGALSGREVKVWEVSANLITLGETLPSAIATGVTFAILRHKYPTVDSTGALITLATEVATAADGGALPAVVKVIGGYDGTNVQVIKTDASGELQVDVLSSALPTGAATEATLSTLATEASLAGLNSVVATETTLNSINTLVGSLANCVDVAEIQVDVVSSALPVGAATEATVSTLATEATVSTLATETTVSAIKTAVEIIDNAISGNEMQVDIVSSALPSGAATETTLAAIKTAVELIDNAVSGNELQVDVVTSALPAGAATESTLASIEGDTSSLAGCVSGSEVQVDIVSSALPSGAATESTLADIKTSVQLLDNAVSGNELQVDIVAPLPSGTNNIGDVDVVSIVPSTGRSIVTRARHVYSVTPVTTAAYQQLVLSLAATVNEVEIFDSSGETLVLATGGAGSEVDQAFVFPGGNGRIPLTITSGTRISVKAVSATANAGEIAINFYS